MNRIIVLSFIFVLSKSTGSSAMDQNQQGAKIKAHLLFTHYMLHHSKYANNQWTMNEQCGCQQHNCMYDLNQALEECKKIENIFKS